MVLGIKVEMLERIINNYCLKKCFNVGKLSWLRPSPCQGPYIYKAIRATNKIGTRWHISSYSLRLFHAWKLY